MAARYAAVVAVELHSAPTRGPAGVSSSVASFRVSLGELSGWDWHGAALVVEHCDAWNADHAPAKGFLSLQDELAAIEGMPVGISINWARSVRE
jgi:hypothetical protein